VCAAPQGLLAPLPSIRYAIGAMSRSEMCAMLAFLAALSSLRWALPIDERVFQWMQFHRTCSWIRWSRWIDPVVRAGLVLLLGLAIVRGGWRDPRKLALLVLVFLGGSAAVELLKTAIERLRPNSVPGMVTGNSFPSGHTTGATMAAVISALMLRETIQRLPLRFAVYGTASGLVALQGIGRLVNGSHWMSDVVGSILLGTAVVFGAGAVQRLPRPLTIGAVALAGVAFIVFDDVPGMRVELPSPLDARGTALGAIEFGTPQARAALGDGWEDGAAEPIGPVSWAVSADVRATLRIASAADGVLKVTLRPATGVDNRRLCVRVAISVNGWRAPEIYLVRGWREYHIEPPRGTLHAGDNVVRFRIVAEPGPIVREPGAGLAAFRFMRFYPWA
jgi:membrane-associated phospholipid phosphatase